ncbi:MAG: glutathione S-transferase [Pseudomonas sp.]|uniref:glutathione S-transferase family protein n=1 Tax=Pseudomonas abieticivorans TaxID=2931382 RepID=UPI0020C04DC0|nr:glutathione S-transferase [Pseudomonas sp. PIA16]MDE1163867.1 glutathione S-transferase [Pseudomonas sp.]
MLQIFGRASSINVRKVLWACAELHIPFERQDWGNGFKATDTPEFLALNPNAMVPVIKDGDFILWESNAIIRYLANCFGGEHLYSREPRTRARIDQWTDWQASDLNRAWSYPFMSLVRHSPLHQDAEALAAGGKEWTKYMTILDSQLAKTGAYVAGADFSLADIPIGLSVNRWFETPLEHAQLPAVRAYYERLSQRAGFTTHGRNGLP